MAVLAVLAVLGVLTGAVHAFAGERQRDGQRDAANPNWRIEIPSPHYHWRGEHRDGYYDRSGYWLDERCCDGEDY